MPYFHFERLINKYSREFTATYRNDGYYDDRGEYVDVNPISVKLTGAILNFTESKIYRAEGTLTTRDKRLFMLKALDTRLIGATVVDDEQVYRIEEVKENAVFTGVYAYTLKWVSAFDNAASGTEIIDGNEVAY